MRVLLQDGSIAMGLGVLLQGSCPALTHICLQSVQQHAVSAARIAACPGVQRASCVQASNLHWAASTALATRLEWIDACVTEQYGRRTQRKC